MAERIHKREIAAVIARREGWTEKGAARSLDAVIGGLQ